MIHLEDNGCVRGMVRIQALDANLSHEENEKVIYFKAGRFR